MNHQFQAPRLTLVNKYILIATGVCFLVHSILTAIGAFSLVQILGLSSSGLFSGLIYQLVTYPLIETRLMSALFNGLLIWFIGSELEGLWGRKIYLRFLLINILVVGLIYTLVNLILFKGTFAYATPIHGLSGLSFSLLTAYAMLYPDRQMAFMMIFPMRARTFCLILAGIEAYMAIFSSIYSSWAHLLAMGISYGIIRFQTRPLIKKVLNASFHTKKQSKNHLYVVKDEDQNPPKFWH
jgi:membrane associated rhomboid family serine protease